MSKKENVVIETFCHAGKIYFLRINGYDAVDLRLVQEEINRLQKLNGGRL